MRSPVSYSTCSGASESFFPLSMVPSQAAGFMSDLLTASPFWAPQSLILSSFPIRPPFFSGWVLSPDSDVSEVFVPLRLSMTNWSSACSVAACVRMAVFFAMSAVAEECAPVAKPSRVDLLVSMTPLMVSQVTTLPWNSIICAIRLPLDGAVLSWAWTGASFALFVAISDAATGSPCEVQL